jgi:hypothetical protein
MCFFKYFLGGFYFISFVFSVLFKNLVNFKYNNTKVGNALTIFANLECLQFKELNDLRLSQEVKTIYF